jgi:ATP-binding cassette subfamily F protein uup
LVLDEQTNDLDAETLELLEDLMVEYSGSLLLVSHDREFLDNVVSSTLFIAPDGSVKETVGGYADWLREQQNTETTLVTGQQVRPAEKKLRPARERPRKLTFKEERELEQLPDQIAALEDEQQQIHDSLADPGFYRNSGDQVAEFNQRLEQLDTKLEQLYSRWEELESLR